MGLTLRSLQPDRSPVAPHDVLGNRKPKAGSSRLRREEGVEHSITNRTRHSVSPIFDAAHHFPTPRRGWARKSHGDGTQGRRGFNSIQHEIEENLKHLVPICKRKCTALGFRTTQVDAVFSSTPRGKLEGPIHKRGEIDRFHARLGRFCELQKASDDAVEALRFFEDHIGEGNEFGVDKEARF